MVIKTNKTVPIILWIFLVWKTVSFLKKTLSKRAPAYNPAKWWQHSGSNLCSSTGIAYVIYCSNPEFEGGKKPGKGWCRRLTAYGIYTFFTIWRWHPDLNWSGRVKCCFTNYQKPSVFNGFRVFIVKCCIMFKKLFGVDEGVVKSPKYWNFCRNSMFNFLSDPCQHIDGRTADSTLFSPL